MLLEDIPRPWLDSYEPHIPSRPEFETVSLCEYLDRCVKRFPRQRAISFNGWKCSYKSLHKKAEYIAANLQKAGLKKGDRVAIMLPNLPQTILTYWGVLKAGGIVVMTNPLYMEKELVHHFNDSGARFLITLDMILPRITSLRDALQFERIFFTRISDCLPWHIGLLYRIQQNRSGNRTEPDITNKTILPWQNLLDSKASYTPVNIDPQKDLALLQYTGGTTGRSKGVMLSHANITTNIQQVLAILYELGDKPEIFLGLLPYFHIYGLTVCLNLATAIGATQIPYPRFVPKDILRSVTRTRPTIFPAAPAVFNALLQQKDIGSYDLTSIRYSISGSAPLAGETMDRFKSMTGAEIIEGYGLTEASPITHLNPLHGKRKSGSIGLPFPGTDACIVDMEVGSVPLPPGKKGELVIKGPQIMKGYWNNSHETASVLREGWLYTGDIAVMDEEGYFYIVDRKKDMIITGGYNVYPREIDEVLLEHPKIKEAVAVGIPSPTRGEIIKAYIVPAEGSDVDKPEILRFCRQKLAGYKIPRQVEFREELPKTLVGKILRRALREEEEKKNQHAPDHKNS